MGIDNIITEALNLAAAKKVENIQSTLNPKIWANQDKIRPEVRDEILQITEDFMEEDDQTDAVVEDALLSGSLANYNWSNSSDLDISLVFNFKKDKCGQIKKSYLIGKGIIWNEHHDVKIYGFPIELFIQEPDDPLYSSGIFSIKKNKWINKPSREKGKIVDERNVLVKAEAAAKQIAVIEKLVHRGHYQSAIAKATALKDRLWKLRASDLEKKGEMSVENLAHKLLRREGCLDRLTALRQLAYDSMRTLK